ncbi:MAG: hypothetical protein MPN21_09245 [Thermoanaerobaculia bacterium]|nr:hypothetical protein [Thermoanaerobaculia bacterium]
MSQNPPAEVVSDTQPKDLESLLAYVEAPRVEIYRAVRGALDRLEEAAPWDQLYYPPSANEMFLKMEERLVGVIDDGHRLVDDLIRDMRAYGEDDGTESLISDLEFFFFGINESVRLDLHKLRGMLASCRERASEVTAEERDFISELSADLKGKYSSSIMGAASSLIAEGRWRGIQIETILFPEKAAEFERNERLVETLSDVTKNISNLLQDVPLAELVQRWQSQEKIDQYALTPLYSLLGNLGKLMQETSRRALYSGDYHQIQRRESLLSMRVNELATLHNMTWGIGPKKDVDIASIFPVMIRKATELAAVLDVDILKEIVGGKQVDDLLMVVTLEKENAPADAKWDVRRDESAIPPSPARQRIPEEQHSLIPLLYDEDLNTFLELLLGSVLKRASLSLKKDIERAQQAAADRAAAEERGEEPHQPLRIGWSGRDDSALEAELESFAGPDTFDVDLGDRELEPEPPPVAVSPRELQQALAQVQELILDAMSRSNAGRKSFQLILRLLKQGRTIPPAMFQSMQPYLYDLMNLLIPKLNDPKLGGRYTDRASTLFDLSQRLCRPNPSPEEMRSEVPESMQKLETLLETLRGTVDSELASLI